MEIKLTHDAVVRTPLIDRAFDAKLKKGVDLPIEGSSENFTLTVTSVDVAADCLVNRGWKLKSPKRISLPVIRNPHGLVHPDEFVFDAEEGRLLTREEVAELKAAAEAKRAAKEKKSPVPPVPPVIEDPSAPPVDPDAPQGDQPTGSESAGA